MPCTYGHEAFDIAIRTTKALMYGGTLEQESFKHQSRKVRDA
jgi:hypothetical protein